MNYKLGSLFDGSGGFPLAGTLCGIEPVWAAEVEPYPIAVTSSRMPKMKHLGDICKVNGAEIEPVDIITFGSPCQDLSVAGKRAGLKHEDNGDDETTRSGLFMEAVRIIKEMRKATNGRYPTFALWENVPGAFSSNKGEDFRIVLEELIKIAEPTAAMPPVPQGGWAYADSYRGDGWSLAYRLFDAQYWGVPQRRRRIYLVADFRGGCAQKVLFEREGLRRHSSESRTQGQGTTADAEGSIGADDREGASCFGVTTKGNGDAFLAYERHTALSAGGGQAGQGYPAAMIPYTLKIRSGCEGGGKGALVQEDKSATLATNNDQYLFQPMCVGADFYNQELSGDIASTLGVNCGVSTGRNGVITDTHILDDQGGSVINVRKDGKAPTLRAQMGGHPPVVMVEGLDAYNQALTGDKAKTLNSAATDSDHIPCTVMCMGTQQGGAEICENLCPTITAAAGMSGNNQPVACYAVDQGAGKSSVCVTKDIAPSLACTNDGSPAVAYSQQAYDEFIENTVSCTLKHCGGTYGGGSETIIAVPVSHTVSYGFDPSAARDVGDLFIEECSKTITNGTSPGHHNGVVAADASKPHYIVRRLTPTECARLQGFPDRWGDINNKDDFTDEEYRFWLDVRKTHDEINGRKPKDYTKKQMLDWYNKLHTDSAEYKMWGNGIALPTALYCMEGIADALDSYNKGETR